jgi:DNA-binding response OmpR family regulator
LRSHGGEASLQYEPKGFACEIRLPIANAANNVGLPGAELQPRPVLQDGQRPGLIGKRILLIEDEPLVSMDMESVLSAAGCVICGPAGNIDEARRLSNEGEYHAALLDANLEGHPVDEIAELLGRRDCAFAFVTGYGREALPAGFRNAALLGKPYSPDQLLTTVELLLGSGAELMHPQQKSNNIEAQSALRLRLGVS